MTDTMKAVIYNQYGSPDVLKLEEVRKPVPKKGEVLIKVHAATATAGDINIRGFTFVPKGMRFLPRLVFGLFRPRRKILGTEVAGEVVAVGKGVTRFQVGDAVFGIGSLNLGAYAEYVCRPAKGGLAHIPEGFSFEEAAATPFGAGTALYFLKDLGKLQPGQTVLVNGASGGVGNYTVQLAKAFGAEVTGVCSTRNVELVREFGADHVIDYTKEDFTQNHGEYDLIVDTVYEGTTYERCKQALKPNGHYLSVAGGLGVMWQSLWNKQILTGTPKESLENIVLLGELLEQGKIKPFIDRRYDLKDTAEAHRYVETARKRGNVVIAMG